MIPWWLLLPQGVSGAIKCRAGYQPFRELAQRGRSPRAERSRPRRASCPFKAIIHVAGISMLWRSSEKAIRSCVRNALKIASEKSYGSIAFPLIGTGTGGYAPEKAIEIMRSTKSRCK